MIGLLVIGLLVIGLLVIGLLVIGLLVIGLVCDGQVTIGSKHAGSIPSTNVILLKAVGMTLGEDKICSFFQKPNIPFQTLKFRPFHR